MFAFLSIFSINSANEATGIQVTFYSMLELSDTDIFMTKTLRICGISQVALQNEIKVLQAIIFLPRNRKIK